MIQVIVLKILNCITGGNVKRSNQGGEQLGSSSKSHTEFYMTNNNSFRNIQRRTKNVCPHKTSYINVHSNVIDKHQKVGKNPNIHQLTKEKQNVVYPYSVILLGHKKK